jgi:O-antigen/teichoic acid export membrane protein
MSYPKNIGHNIMTQALKIILGTLTGIIVARALGPVGQGNVAYIVLIFNLLGTFGHLGIINAVAYFQKKSGFERTAIYSTNVNLLILLSLLFSIMIIALFLQGAVLQAYSPWFVLGGIILMVSTLFTTHHQSWLMGDEKIIQSNKIALTVFMLKSLVILSLWLLGLLTPFSFFLLTVLAMCLWFILIHSSLGESYLKVISLPVLKAELSYGLLAWAAALFAFMHYRADQIMIKHMLGMADLGVYTIAVSIAELLFLFPISIHSALSGRLYNLEADNDGRSLISRTLRVSIIVCMALCLLGLAGSFLIPYVYGAPYREATVLMQILLPGVLFACLPKVLSPWFFSSGRPIVHLRITIVCLLLNVALNSLLIPLYGIRGAALASSISYILYGLYYLLLMKFGEGFSFSELLVFSRHDWQIAKGLWQR